MATPTPYRISVPQSSIDRLQQKLSLATFPDELDDAGWDMGVPLAEMKRITKAWQTFDWRATEQKINDELPQFMLQIEMNGFGTIDVHFVHKRSERADAIPLLFVHGCPYTLRISLPLHGTHTLSLSSSPFSSHFSPKQSSASLTPS